MATHSQCILREGFLQSDVLFEDQDLFILNKRPHRHSCQSPQSNNPSLADDLLSICAHLANVSEKAEDAGLVQRLDFQTSGCILGAKNKNTWENLRELLKKEQIKKEYMAILEGQPPKSFEVRGWIGTPYRRASKVKVYTSEPRKRQRALKADTFFELLHYSKQNDLALVKAYAPRARRHQIRAHSGFSGYPLAGDALYGARSNTNAWPKDEFPIDFMLHASTLSFTHPKSRMELKIEAPIPNFVQKLFKLIDAG